MLKKLLVCFVLLSQCVSRPVQAEAWFTGLVAGAGFTLFALDGARDYKKFKRHGDRKMLQDNKSAQSDIMMHGDHALPAGNRSFLSKNKEAFIASFKDLKQFFNYYYKEVPKKRFGFFHVGLGMMAASLLQAKTGCDYEGEIKKKVINGKDLIQAHVDHAKNLEDRILEDDRKIKHLNQRIVDLESQPPVLPLRNEDAVELDRLRQESDDLGNKILALQRELLEKQKLQSDFNRQQEELLALEVKHTEVVIRLNENKPALPLRPEEKQGLENKIKDLEAEIVSLQSDLAAKPKVTSHARGRGGQRGRGGRGHGALPQTPVKIDVKNETPDDVVVSDEKKEILVVDDSKREVVVNDGNKVEHFSQLVDRDLLDSCFFGEAEESNKKEKAFKVDESNSSASVDSSLVPQPIEYAEDFSLSNPIPVEDSSLALLSEKQSVSIQVPLASDLTQKASEEDLSVSKSEKTKNKVEQKEDLLPKTSFKNVLSNIRSFSSGSLKKGNQGFEKKEAPAIKKTSEKKDENKIPVTDVLPAAALSLIIEKGQQVVGTGIYTGPQETVYNDGENDWGSMVFDLSKAESESSHDSKHNISEKKEKEEGHSISPQERLRELGITQDTVLTYDLVVAIKADAHFNDLYRNLTDDQKGHGQWVEFDKEHKIELQRIQDEQNALERERNAPVIQAMMEGQEQITNRGNLFKSEVMNGDTTTSDFWDKD